MLRCLAIALLTTQVTIMAGCSYLKYPNVHKLTIRQGNIIDQEMIDQLRPGLSRSQVRYILGTPLIADTFDQSRWDYFYSIKQPGQEELRERISVFFTDEKLSYFTGDYRPSTATTLNSDNTHSQTPEAPLPPGQSPATQSPETFSIEAPDIEASSVEP